MVLEFDLFHERLKDENGIKAHPTQKPLKLIQQVVLASSKKGDLVLDPFLGSGTTAVVAKALERNWIGIEKEKKYADMVEKKLDFVNLNYHPKDDLICLLKIIPNMVSMKEAANTIALESSTGTWTDVEKGKMEQFLSF